MVNAFLKTTMLETTMHPNSIFHGRYNIENNNVGNNSAFKWQMHFWNKNVGNNGACLDMTYI